MLMTSQFMDDAFASDVGKRLGRERAGFTRLAVL